MTDPTTATGNQTTDPQVEMVALHDFVLAFSNNLIQSFRRLGEQVEQAMNDPATVAALDKMADLVKQYKAMQPPPLTRSQLDQLPKGKRRVISLQPRRQPHSRSPRKNRSPSLATHRR